VAHTKFSLVYPVRNGGDLFVRSIESVLKQSARPSEILIFDTESTDGAIERAKDLLKRIPTRIFSLTKQEFDHGGTRNTALEAAKHTWVLFLTQDAVCASNDALANLLTATKGKGIVAAYGRQLPHHDATALAATARVFNYPETSHRQDMSRATELGIKTWFCSNSFSLWHKPSLIRQGGFQSKLILGEDAEAAARLIQAGAAVAYAADAQVYHSHNYSALEEFKRYFDIGVFHEENRELLFKAGSANKEGLKFVRAQLNALWLQRAFLSLIKFPFHVAAKAIGYKLGRKFNLLPTWLRSILSMHKNYWISKR